LKDVSSYFENSLMLKVGIIKKTGINYKMNLIERNLNDFDERKME